MALSRTPSAPPPAADFPVGNQPHGQPLTDDQLDALKQRVLDAIATVSYPARRDTLVDSAREHQAAGDVVDALRALPDESYGSFSEVSALIAALK